jgi:hypothetical protein
MKNRKQILSYLKGVRIATDKDELAIESYLSRRNIVLDLSKFRKAGKVALPDITLEEFAEWFAPDLPDRNEVIVIEASGLIGITGCLCVDELVLGVSLSADGLLTVSEARVAPTPYRQATEDEKIRLQRALNREGYLWNLTRSKLLPTSPVADNLQLRLSLLGTRLAVGVFREISSDGKIVMYCVKENDKPVRYSLYEPVADSSDYQLEPVSAQEREMLASELEKAGKVWNGFAKRIEPVNFRAEKGQVYYYIDDFMEITATQEKEKPKDLKRLRSGNYYRNRDDAEEMLALTEEYRKKQLVNFSLKEERTFSQKSFRGKKKAKNNNSVLS